MLIVRQVADRQEIVALSAEAAASGIRRGMTLTQARALQAGVAHALHDPGRDRRALEALARWLMRFSPVVALDEPDEGSKNHGRRHRDAGPASLFLDITGCERLFGGIGTLLDQASRALARLKIGACLAAAPTPGAAWALAYGGRNKAIVMADELESALAPLPAASLRIGPDLCAALHHLGLATVGQVMRLPRGALPARFGPELLRRLDQALGEIAEPLAPLPHLVPLETRMDFDGVVTSLEAIHAVFQRLLDELIGALASRGCGARRLEVDLLRAYAPPVRKTIHLSRPTRNPRTMVNLFRCSVEGSGLGAQGSAKNRVGRRLFVLSCTETDNGPPADKSHESDNIYDEGFVGLRLAVPLFERIRDEQVHLLDGEEYAGRLELDHLIERLRVRMGEEAVAQAVFAESHLPEQAWSAAAPSRNSERPAEARAAAPSLAFMPMSLGPNLSCPKNTLPPRPLRLLRSPLEVRVMVSPSHDADGRPIAFFYGHEMHRAVHTVGPERIASRWWDGHDKTRDYFEVENPVGRRFWIFRVLQTGKWYVHGLFE